MPRKYSIDLNETNKMLRMTITMAQPTNQPTDKEPNENQNKVKKVLFF